ncbi:cyclic-phosphate processing receiver domain-containing protein [Vibrio variabilis]|uniref:cyclic-phosphate processing receiver domain-containing protein n=1 Tax=Vibrio variabilis TaxID=990271 RepID=UPI000DD59766|nr:cyclic-phosphate processing receiver domain-containing protein [Vibrio variabilis]
MKVYLDDERTAPEGWKRVYWPEEAIELLQSGEVEEISLDHDLGDDTLGTGYDVVVWIEEQVIVNRFKPPKILVHSANSSARIKMEMGISNIYANAVRDLRST